MIWWLHINLTVYNQYPTLEILGHNHLVIDALLELEMTKCWFSFKAQFPRIKRINQSVSRCWGRIYAKQIILMFIKGIFNQEH